MPEDRRDSLTDHDLRSRDDAVGLLDDLEADAVAPTSRAAGGGGEPARQAAEAGAERRRARRAAAAGAAAARQAAAPGGRRRNGRRAAARLSARNRELLALVPVAVIVAAGFAAVFIVKDERGLATSA